TGVRSTGSRRATRTRRGSAMRLQYPGAWLRTAGRALARTRARTGRSRRAAARDGRGRERWQRAVAHARGTRRAVPRLPLARRAWQRDRVGRRAHAARDGDRTGRDVAADGRGTRADPARPLPPRDRPRGGEP